MVGIAGHDGRPALAALEHGFARIEPKPAENAKPPAEAKPAAETKKAGKPKAVKSAKLAPKALPGWRR